MKKIISLLLLITVIGLAFASCSFFSDNITSTKIRIGYMAGPTGMGMAKLISDNGGLESGNEKYSFTKYTDTQLAKADLAAGKIDIICLPTNEAATYFTTIDNDVKVLAVNCLNSLYYIGSGIMGNSEFKLSDLEGQVVYTCKNGTPRIILEHILKESGISATVSYTVDGKEIITPQDLSAQVIAGNIPNAVMPEPVVTSTILKTVSSSDTNKIFSVLLDFGEEWDKLYDTPLTMGCIISSGSFAKKNKDLINDFLEEYKASVEYIGSIENVDSAADYVVETGVMSATPAAKKALTNLNGSIAYLDGEEMKAALISFYTAIGVKLPDDTFYYEK